MDPFIISSIILAISFVFILILNQKLKSKIIKISFTIFSLIYLILILIFDNKFLYEFFKAIITYLWYPNYLLFVITILMSIIVLIYSILKKRLPFRNKVINYLLFSILFSCYIIFQRLQIDTDLYSSLYSSNSLIILRITSITFIVWFILNIIFKLLDRSKYEK